MTYVYFLPFDICLQELLLLIYRMYLAISWCYFLHTSVWVLFWQHMVFYAEVTYRVYGVVHIGKYNLLVVLHDEVPECYVLIAFWYSIFRFRYKYVPKLISNVMIDFWDLGCRKIRNTFILFVFMESNRGLEKKPSTYKRADSSDMSITVFWMVLTRNIVNVRFIQIRCEFYMCLTEIWCSEAILNMTILSRTLHSITPLRL